MVYWNKGLRDRYWQYEDENGDLALPPLYWHVFTSGKRGSCRSCRCVWTCWVWWWYAGTTSSRYRTPCPGTRSAPESYTMQQNGSIRCMHYTNENVVRVCACQQNNFHSQNACSLRNKLRDSYWQWCWFRYKHHTLYTSLCNIHLSTFMLSCMKSDTLVSVLLLLLETVVLVALFFIARRLSVHTWRK